MAITKTIELTSASKKGFDDALASGLAKAAQTVKGINGAWIADHKVEVADGKIANYIIRMQVTFTVK